jgi:hypothetical protein
MHDRQCMYSVCNAVSSCAAEDRPQCAAHMQSHSTCMQATLRSAHAITCMRIYASACKCMHVGAHVGSWKPAQPSQPSNEARAEPRPSRESRLRCPWLAACPLLSCPQVSVRRGTAPALGSRHEHHCTVKSHADWGVCLCRMQTGGMCPYGMQLPALL